MSTAVERAIELSKAWGYSLTTDELLQAFEKGNTYAQWIKRAVNGRKL